MRAAHARRMRGAGLGAVDAVAAVLAGERSEAVARHIERRHLRDADDPAAGLPDAGGELAVLVDRPVLVPAPMRLNSVSRRQTPV